MRQFYGFYFTPEGEVSNYFNFLKKFEIRTERPTKNKPTHLSGFYYFSAYGKKMEKNLAIFSYCNNYI